MSDDNTMQVANLLQKAGDVHHQVFADTDGNDEDWATFYSDWLLAHSNLSQLLGRRPIRSHLTRDLVELDTEYTSKAAADPWPAWYAQRLIAKYA